MENDNHLLDWIQKLEKFGFVLVQNVPIEEGQISKLQNRIGFPRITHYG